MTDDEAKSFIDYDKRLCKKYSRIFILKNCACSPPLLECVLYNCRDIFISSSKSKSDFYTMLLKACERMRKGMTVELMRATIEAISEIYGYNVGIVSMIYDWMPIDTKGAYKRVEKFFC
jgi:hypothetical protein